MLEFIIGPFVNIMLFMYSLLGQNFGLTIIVFTIVIRLLTFPFTRSQTKSTQALQEMQNSDKWKKIQEKYKDDKEKLAQEQMKLYQEMGINPFGSCLPTLIQFPIIFALYYAVQRALAATPIPVLELARTSWLPNAAELIPLNNQFLWMDLSQPERLHVDFLPFPIPVLTILVVITFLPAIQDDPAVWWKQQSAGSGYGQHHDPDDAVDDGIFLVFILCRPGIVFLHG